MNAYPILISMHLMLWKYSLCTLYGAYEGVEAHAESIQYSTAPGTVLFYTVKNPGGNEKVSDARAIYYP